MVNSMAVQDAIARLATRLAAPVDIITIHRANMEEAKRNPRYEA
ncbi:hypothetical protein AB0873_11045 [Micromonospora sp. NPDC047707]